MKTFSKPSTYKFHREIHEWQMGLVGCVVIKNGIILGIENFDCTLLERKVPLRHRQDERNNSKNLVPDCLFFQTTPAFPPSLLTLMSKYGAWVTS
jgi:hypothetical protein